MYSMAVDALINDECGALPHSNLERFLSPIFRGDGSLLPHQFGNTQATEREPAATLAH